MTILEKIKFEEDWLSEVNLTKENVKIALAGIRATALEQQQQPCEDCISRQAAIDVVRKWFDKIQLNGDICLDGIISLPSVTPQQKIGRWIKTSLTPISGGDFNQGIKCSCCDYKTVVDDFYCPNCGAKMEVEE